MDRSPRRRSEASKGDLRERAILDAVERHLSAEGPYGMTVESIASAAGITRAALYFYFGSKNDVLAALVDREMATLRRELESIDASAESDVAAALDLAIHRTGGLWTAHSAVMRAAVELSPTIPAIDESWRSTVNEFVNVTAAIAARGGFFEDGADHPIVTALAWLTERTFYQAVATGRTPTETEPILMLIWRRTLGLH
jgi:AcrR family transcriptional regulator